MTIAPLFVKYQSKSGKFFVYDCDTNEIVRIGETIYNVLDDFGVLTVDEMVQKYHSLGEDNVRGALVQLDRLQARGILLGHVPATQPWAERVLCQGKEEAFEDFLNNHRRMLTLELTQQCNLRCDYCAYGEYYPEFRMHGSKPMSLTIAQKAIRDYFSHSQCNGIVTFYGGEPLLEFDLLKQIVLFAEEIGHQCGINPDFQVTTNGTLLTEDRIRFLVDHDIFVTVSLDGNKEAHDRHRVFRSEQGTERRIGSFDVVMHNMRRFTELFPDYQRRGLAVTLTATSDFDEVNEFLKPLMAIIQTIVARFVRPPDERFHKTGDVLTFQTGCWRTPRCTGGCLGYACAVSPNSNDSHVLIGPENDSLRQKLPDFANWTKERQDRFRSSYEYFLTQLYRFHDGDAVKKEFPLYWGLVAVSAKFIHQREMPVRNVNRVFRYPCLAGSTRTFCTSCGAYLPCERTATGKLFELGNAGADVDAKYARRLIELARSLTDCGNCAVKSVCPVCFSRLPESLENNGAPDTIAFQRICRETLRSYLPKALKEYTDGMEVNPELFEGLSSGNRPGDWLNDVSIVATEEQLREVEVGTEEIEEVV